MDAIKLPDDFNIKQKTIQDLKPGEFGYVEPSAMIVQPSLACQLLSNSPVENQLPQYTTIKVECLINGFKVAIPKNFKNKYNAQGFGEHANFRENCEYRGIKFIPVTDIVIDEEQSKFDTKLFEDTIVKAVQLHRENKTSESVTLLKDFLNNNVI